MKKMVISLFFGILMWCSISLAAQVTGEGYGTTREDAKKEALADLSQKIQVNVKSEFSSLESATANDYDKQAVKIITMKSDLPLMGVDYEIVNIKSRFHCMALLDFKTVTQYEAALKSTKNRIDSNLKRISAIQSNEEKVKHLNQILTDLDQFEKIRIVAQFMGSSQIPEIRITPSEIRNQLSDLEKKADTIDFGLKKAAAGIMSVNIQVKNIYIYPPTVQNSSEITEFAGAIKDRLSVYLNTVTSPKDADYFIEGEYRILKNSIDLVLRLLDHNQNTVGTVMTSFLPAAYADYRTKPRNADFDRLLTYGMVVSGDLRANITTSMGKKDLLFRDKDAFKILVKMNKPGYFYFLVHTNKGDEKYSYLVDFYNAEGNRKFVYHINADDVNRWITIGDFEVVPPFGVESIQMIASSADVIDKIPSNQYDQKTKLYKVIGSQSDTVLKTRGLIRKDRLKEKTEMTENVLVITTMKK